MTDCRLCRRPGAVDPLLDFGDQALCNRFLLESNADEATFPLALGLCGACGMIQLVKPAPAEELISRFDWITYREAEGHLDDLVDRIAALPGVTTESAVGGISFKDDSTLARFQALGHHRTWRVPLSTPQFHLTPAVADQIVQDHGAADVLIARHIVEHAVDPVEFLATLRRLVKPDGHIVLEVPDCGPALQRGDYTMTWEEHVLYFTADLLRQAVSCWNLTPVAFAMYPYSHENSLVAIVRATAPAQSDPAVDGAGEGAKTLGRSYAAGLSSYRDRVTAALIATRQAGGSIAMFGAGHLSCAWLNFMGLRDHIGFVADDQPQKRGLFMPGSRLPILASSELVSRGITLCLSTLNAESQAKVIAKNQQYLENGGRFADIFPGHPNALVA